MAKIRSIIQALTVVSFIGILYFTFSLETATALVLLLILITAQVIFIKRRTKVANTGFPERSASDISNLIQNINRGLNNTEKVDEAKEENSAVHKTVGEKISEKESTVPSEKSEFNPDIFAKFQSNLNKSQKKLEKTDPKQEEVILSLSGKSAKEKKTAKTDSDSKAISNLKKKVDKKTNDLKVDPLAGLFDDVTEKLGPENPALKGYSGKVRPKPPKEMSTLTANPESRVMDKIKELSEKTKTDKPEIETEIAVAEKEDIKTTESEIKPLIAQEVLTSSDLKIPENIIRQDAEICLRKAKEAELNSEYDKGIEVISNWENQLKEVDLIPDSDDWEIILLKGVFLHEIGEFTEAVKTWELLIQKYVFPSHVERLPTLEKIVSLAINSENQKMILPFLFSLLNEYRKQDDKQKMDELYDEVGIAYKQLDDGKRLVQTYRNHLDIKKELNDYNGQLELLDHLGKILYDQGDAAGSNYCYEQSIKLKREISNQ